jgi:phospholipase/carboxylesterase
MISAGEDNMPTIIRQTIAGLSTLTRQLDDSSAKPDKAIIFLHGWGADGADLMDLSNVIAMAHPTALFYAPDGPEPCSANPMGRQWFALDGDQASIDRGPDQAMPALKEMLDHITSSTGLGLNRIWLLGFSQGGMMALHIGTRLAESLGGVMSFSGALLAPDQLAKSITSRPPVLLVHGQDDQVVPFQALAIAEAVLAQNDVTVTSLPRPGLDHGIDQDGFQRGIAFIEETSGD